MLNRRLEAAQKAFKELGGNNTFYLIHEPQNRCIIMDRAMHVCSHFKTSELPEPENAYGFAIHKSIEFLKEMRGIIDQEIDKLENIP